MENIEKLIKYNFKKEELLKEFAGSETLLKKVADVNLKHFPVTFNKIKAAGEGDYKTVGRYSHTLRGSIGLFFDDKTYFWQYMKELEENCKQEVVDRTLLMKKIRKVELILAGFEYCLKKHKWNVEE